MQPKGEIPMGYPLCTQYLRLGRERRKTNRAHNAKTTHKIGNLPKGEKNRFHPNCANVPEMVLIYGAWVYDFDRAGRAALPLNDADCSDRIKSRAPDLPPADDRNSDTTPNGDPSP
jgi:hypothetical protein